jgi:hypothetical protein
MVKSHNNDKIVQEVFLPDVLFRHKAAHTGRPLAVRRAIR